MKKNNLTDKQLAEMLKKAGKGFNLSESDKGIMRSELNDVIKSGPVRTNEWSNITNIIKPRKIAMPFIPMLIAIIIAFGGGTAALADSTAPGHWLYPVDTFVEDFVERFTKSDESKAVLHAQRIEERMQELEVLETKIQALADSGEIDAETLEKKRTWLENHKERLTEKLEKRIDWSKNATDKLQEKFGEINTERGKKGLKRALGTLEEIGARQKLMIGIWKEPGIELPLIDPELRAKLEAQREAHQKKMEELRQQILEQWEKDRAKEKEEEESKNPFFPDEPEFPIVPMTDSDEVENEDNDLIEDVLEDLSII